LESEQEKAAATAGAALALLIAGGEQQDWRRKFSDRRRGRETSGKDTEQVLLQHQGADARGARAP